VEETLGLAGELFTAETLDVAGARTSDRREQAEGGTFDHGSRGVAVEDGLSGGVNGGRGALAVLCEIGKQRV
jgi:hypothetical protein